MLRLRSFALTLLVLAMMAASVVMAQARHQARAVVEVVLCTGHGMASIEVDADGNPVGPMLPCPECHNAAAGLDIAPASAVLAPNEISAPAHALRELPAPARNAPVCRHARAPPVAV